MCTAVTYQTEDFYFGRNLDYEALYGESVTITPRRYVFQRPGRPAWKPRYALIGMAHVCEGYPLYYDAVNEKGLCMAGLNFVGNAVYPAPVLGRESVAVYELIPWLLGRCASVREAREQLSHIALADVPFRADLPCAQLHWLVADKHDCLTVESVREGLRLYENPIGVLTNNPPFPVQMTMLSQYRALSPKPPESRFAAGVPWDCYSRGMGAIGLPGDLSSSSRFVRAAFTKLNAVSGKSEEESVSQMFHILGAVEQSRGCCELSDGQYEITQYTSCCNADKGIYYYTTYESRRIRAVSLASAETEGTELLTFPLQTAPSIAYENGGDE